MIPSTETIVVRRDLQREAKLDAEDQRATWTARGTLVVNLLSSPGSGKTALLEVTAQRMSEHYRMAVLVGDLETDRDAQRLSGYVPAVQLTTGGACHLELPLVRRGIEALEDPVLDFLFIENVGNLVCPASHDLAEHLRVVLISTTEGDDKPGKYPKIFRTSQAMLVTKTDLLPHVPFRTQSVREDARRIQPDLDILEVCAIDGSGIDAWCDYLVQRRSSLLTHMR